MTATTRPGCAPDCCAPPNHLGDCLRAGALRALAASGWDRWATIPDCQAPATAAHMREAHGWTIYASEETDQAALNAMHRCALENAAAEHTHHEGPACALAEAPDSLEGCRHRTCADLAHEICQPCEAEAATHYEAGEVLCAEGHGWQAVAYSGRFTGYAGGTCYAATLACGCGLLDESDDIRASI